MNAPRHALDLLADDLREASFVGGTETTDDYQALLLRARRLLDIKVRFEEHRPADAPPLVVIAGGTNVGKSTIFNWVVGDTISSASPLARHTKAPTVFVHKARTGTLGDSALLPSYRRVAFVDPKDATQETLDGVTAYFLKTHERAEVQDVVLVDSPDIDSTNSKNREIAEDLLFLADAVVFVATPEKYNDDICVRYLKQAGELERALVCLLNKGADAEVARDFKEGVVPQVGGDVRVLTLPYVNRPDPTNSGPFLAELRGLVTRPREDVASMRRAAHHGAAAVLGDDLARVAARLREELSELDRIRSELSLVLDARRDEYVRFLDGLEFYELDRVFERVLTYFKLPVIDPVFDAFRGAIGFVSSGVASIVTGKTERDSRKAKLDARNEADRQKVKELLGAAAAEATELPHRHTGTLRSSVQGWLDHMRAPSVEDQNRDVEGFQTQAEAQAERWIERETQRHVELLESHPYARNALRAVKGVFQVGFGLLSAKLTGGFGPWDVLIGTATERATKALIERAGGVVHYQSLKTEMTRERGKLFRELLDRAVAAPLLERLPAGVDPARLDRIDAAAAVLRRGELPR